jgi:GntR family transcriptional repressor for pyruvate dehydrogenase complex
VRALAAKGVIEVRTGSGLRVAAVDAAAVSESMRLFLRGHDGEAASRHDVDFHRAIAEATHNPLYVIMLDSIGDVMLEIRLATIGIPGRPLKAVKAHRRILARIAEHDAGGSRDAMREHLRDSWKVWQQLRRRARVGAA